MFEIIPFDHRMNRLATYKPFRDFDEFERSFFGDGSMVSAFSTDVKDVGDAYVLEAELPGFRKEDINLEIKNDCLCISAEHREDRDDKNDNYVKRERYYGSYSRNFDVSGINTEDIEAEYNDGVLTLKLPKKAETVPEARKLLIK